MITEAAFYKRKGNSILVVGNATDGDMILYNWKRLRGSELKTYRFKNTEQKTL